LTHSRWNHWELLAQVLIFIVSKFFEGRFVILEILKFVVGLFKPELIDDISFLLSLLFIELFQVVHVLFLGRFKCVTDFEFAFLIAAKIVTSDGMKFIFVVTAHLIAALFVNFGGFDLKGGIGYGGG
jgi:hypothetical protein